MTDREIKEYIVELYKAEMNTSDVDWDFVRDLIMDLDKDSSDEEIKTSIEKAISNYADRLYMDEENDRLHFPESKKNLKSLVKECIALGMFEEAKTLLEDFDEQGDDEAEEMFNELNDWVKEIQEMLYKDAMGKISQDGVRIIANILEHAYSDIREEIFNNKL